MSSYLPISNLLISDCRPPGRAFLLTGCYLFEPLGPKNFKAATNFCREHGAKVNFEQKKDLWLYAYGMDNIQQQ